MESLTQVKVKHRVFEDAVHLTIPPGASIREIIDQAQIPEAAMPNIVVLNHGSIVGDWEYITKDADNLAICVVPQGGRGGGKSILGAVAMIAIAAFAWWAAPYVATAIGFGGSAIATGIIGAGITMVGSLAMNALIKPPALDIGSFSGQGGFGGGGMRGAQTVDNRPQSIADAAEASTYSFGGQSNQARKYSPAIKVYGRHRVFPAIAVNPFIENAGTESKITTIYDFGLGTVTLEDLKIGDADIGTYSPQIETYSGSLMKTTRLYPKRVAYESLSFIPKLDQEIILRTKPQTQSAEVDLYFPRGLVFYDDRGNRTENKVQIEVWWRAVGATTWNKVRDDQFSGASVRQDIAISGRTEVYDPGMVGVNQYDQYNRYVNRTYWLITHYPYTDQPGSGYHSEVTVFFDGAMVYSGPESAVGGSFGEYSIGPKQEEADYLPRAKEYYFAVTRRTTHVTGGTVWKDYQHNKPGVTVYGTQVFVNNQEIYHGPQLMSGIVGDYLKGNYKEDRNPSPILKEALYSIMKPTYSGLTTSTVVGSTSQPFTLVAAVDFVNPGLYEFKIVRKSSNSIDNRNANDITLTLIKSFQAGDIFKLDKKHTMVEMRLLANDKINGVVSNFSAIATSILPVWDGTKWTEKITRNPAWIAYDILTGEANPAALKPEQIDLASFYKLAQLCDEQVTTTVGGATTTGNRYESDFVVDYETTVYQLLESVLSVCRATLIITQSGKYGVLIDQTQTTPRQLFTPANSRNFSGNRTFSDRPHALRVKYVEPNMGWQMNEVIVYDDGKDASNATKFEDLSTFGITDGARAWRYGRYMLAQGLHRSEQFTIELDVENLAVQRGDLVKVAHDVPKIGGVGARIIDITGNDVHVTEGVQVVVSNYTVRLSDGTVRSGTVTGSPADDVFTFDDVTGLQTDDLVVFGATSRVTQDYLVQEIMPGGDLTATLTLVRYVPEIYTADQGLIPPWDSGLTDTIINKTDLKIVNLSGTATLVYPDRLPFSEVKLDWAYEGKNYDHANVFLVRPGYQDLFLGDTKYVDFDYLIDTLKETEKLGLMKFHVIPYNTKGLEGAGAYISVQVDPDVAPPQTPYGFAVNVQKETVNLFWQMNQEEDVDNYIIRYTPEVNSPNWNASMFLARLSWRSTTFSVGARTGTYMIRAVDTSGNQSAISKQRTTVATLPDLNVIDTVDDSITGWTGQNYQTQIRGSALIASGPANAVEPTGFYVVSKTIDLGEVYEARISSKIRAYGESNLDFMSQWTTLSSVPALTRVQSDQWDAWVEVRSTGRMSFMSDWTSLDTVNPMSGGSATWTDWRPVHVGDFTGHLFQFRIQLRSFTPDVRPVVTSGLIEIDMVDRIDYYGDVVVPTAGARVTFDPEFRNVPAIAVTIDGNTDPVVATITNKTSGGVSIALYNTQTNAAVAGKVDVHAQGYGRRGIASI